MGIKGKKSSLTTTLLSLKDGIEKIIIKDKQRTLSFEYIIALFLQKSKYIISIAI